MIKFPVLEQSGPCLVGMKRHIFFNTLRTKIQYPVIVTNMSIGSKFHTDSNLHYRTIKICP